MTCPMCQGFGLVARYHDVNGRRWAEWVSCPMRDCSASPRRRPSEEASAAADPWQGLPVSQTKESVAGGATYLQEQSGGIG